jgi:accessory colonization factor AcfC
MPDADYSLNKIQSLLWIGNENKWAAKARNSSDYAFHADPKEAIKLAIDMKEKKDAVQPV